MTSINSRPSVAASNGSTRSGESSDLSRTQKWSRKIDDKLIPLFRKFGWPPRGSASTPLFGPPSAPASAPASAPVSAPPSAPLVRPCKAADVAWLRVPNDSFAKIGQTLQRNQYNVFAGVTHGRFAYFLAESGHDASAENMFWLYAGHDYPLDELQMEPVMPNSGRAIAMQLQPGADVGDDYRPKDSLFLLEKYSRPLRWPFHAPEPVENCMVEDLCRLHADRAAMGPEIQARGRLGLRLQAYHGSTALFDANPGSQPLAYTLTTAQLNGRPMTLNDLAGDILPAVPDGVAAAIARGEHITLSVNFRDEIEVAHGVALHNQPGWIDAPIANVRKVCDLMSLDGDNRLDETGRASSHTGAIVPSISR